MKINKLIRNAVRCHNCSEIVESTYTHDFKWCECGAVAVDGGLDYSRRCFKEGATWDELNEYEEIEVGDVDGKID